MKKIKRVISTVALALMAVFAVMSLSGCIDADYKVTSSKLEGMDYTVSLIESSDIAGCSYILSAWKNQGAADQDYVRICYFDKEDYAISYYESTFLTYSVPQLQANNPDLAGQLEYLRVLNIVIYGTSGGVEDALS